MGIMPFLPVRTEVKKYVSELLLGELKAQEGSITVNGKDISATFGKGDLGYVPQNSISRNQNFPLRWKRL